MNFFPIVSQGAICTMWQWNHQARIRRLASEIVAGASGWMWPDSRLS